MPAALENIRMLSLFDGISDHDKDRLLQAGHTHKCSRGQMLYAQGDAANHFYIISRGTMQLLRTTPDGHEKTLHILKSGQTLGENEIMEGCSRYVANAIAVEDSVLIEFSATWLKEVSRQYPALGLNLLSLIAQQVHLAELEAEHQATMSASQLVGCFLQRLCVLYGFNPESFELPYSKTLIASRLGMKLETFSRTLSKLKKHGIHVEGTHVSIHDLAQLEHYVCGFCSISDDCATHRAMENLE